jgi:LPS sulfotransferase NodH
LEPNERLRLDLDLFGQMRELAGKQRDALMADRLDEFMVHSSRRQSIQNAISAIHKGQQASLWSGRKRGGKQPDEATRMMQIMETIQRVDKEIEALISLKREALMSQMKEIRHGRKALRGYGKPNRDPGGRFFETKG